VVAATTPADDAVVAAVVAVAIAPARAPDEYSSRRFNVEIDDREQRMQRASIA
jgi:hypothetical protein